MSDLAKRNILTSDDEILGVLRDARTVAVLGIKTEMHSEQPAYFVPSYLKRVGYEVIPVPVYYPDVTEILDRPVYRTLAAVPDPIDLVVVFRRPGRLPAHLDDLIAARPKAVWFQSGIRHDEVACKLAEAGIRVVQDRCSMIDHRRLR